MKHNKLIHFSHIKTFIRAFNLYCQISQGLEQDDRNIYIGCNKQIFQKNRLAKRGFSTVINLIDHQFDYRCLINYLNKEALLLPQFIALLWFNIMPLDELHHALDTTWRETINITKITCSLYPRKCIYKSFLIRTKKMVTIYKNNY